MYLHDRAHTERSTRTQLRSELYSRFQRRFQSRQRRLSGSDYDLHTCLTGVKIERPNVADGGWQKEIRRMLDNGFKMEVESLITKDISYVTEEYVPERLKKKDWLD